MPHVDLLELPYFEGISIDSVVALVDLMEPRHFPAGAVIMEEGSGPPPPLYIATSGRMVISKRSMSQNEERNLAELESPTVFGEIELFCQIPPVATVRALTPSSTFVLTRATFDRLYQAQHNALLMFTFNITRVVCHRLAIADELLANLLGGEDLVKLRRAVFSRTSHAAGAPAGGQWERTTGLFRKP